MVVRCDANRSMRIIRKENRSTRLRLLDDCQQDLVDTNGQREPQRRRIESAPPRLPASVGALASPRLHPPGAAQTAQGPSYCQCDDAPAGPASVSVDGVPGSVALWRVPSPGLRISGSPFGACVRPMSSFRSSAAVRPISIGSCASAPLQCDSTPR